MAFVLNQYLHILYVLLNSLIKCHKWLYVIIRHQQNLGNMYWIDLVGTYFVCICMLFLYK